MIRINSFTLRLKRYFLFAVGVGLIAGGVPLIQPPVVSAADCNQQFYSDNDVLFFDKCAQLTCSSSASNSVMSNKNYAGAEVFTAAQIEAIEGNRSFYESAANAQGIPWQLLAVIHSRETGLRRYGPANGYGPYQITPSAYPIADSYTDEQFQTATNDAALNVKNRAGDKDVSDPNTIKSILFSYNGKAQAYIDQGVSLGFTAEEAANGEGSPYVMNRFDLERDPTAEPTKSNGTWGQIKVDHGSIEYPANNDFGSFVYYQAIADDSLCTENASALNGDADAVQAEFTAYMDANNSRYGSYYLGSNGCTTLSWWFIGEHTTLAYGRGNGEAVVRNLITANSDKGLTVTDRPVAPSIFSVAGGIESWGSSGSSAGHVGVVISVDEVAQTATVVHTGSTKAGQPEKAWVSTYSFPANGVSFVYIGDHLK